MPRNQGTSRKGKPGKNERAVGLGRTLKRAQGSVPSMHTITTASHTGGMAKKAGVVSSSGGGVADKNAANMTTKAKSILELQDIDDFLLQAELANREFVAERYSSLTIEDSTAFAYTGPSRVKFVVDPNDPQQKQQQQHGKSKTDFVFQELSVPRRPEWDASTTPQELQEREQRAFLDWRRAIALKEEELMMKQTRNHKVSVTPFEKNLEVWRQLWRVLERSACLLQLVDARNPLFYISKDLRDYAASLDNKPMMVLINKSDYLTRKQRQLWYDYLTSNGWETVVFFSAYQEQQKLDHQAQQKRKQEQLLFQRYDDYHLEEKEEGNDTVDIHKTDDIVEEEENEEEDDKEEEDEEELVVDDNAPAVQASKQQQEEEQAQVSQDGKGIDVPLTRQQLMDTMLNFARTHNCQPNPHSQNRIPFGMVGFPNVGKSSVINVLMGSSKHTHGLVRVGVASQPGKTKHFQTLLLNDEMLLCDCPGLVFPSFVSNTADLIAAGVYPISQMRDHWPVISLICKRIPREILNAQYGIKLPVTPPPFQPQDSLSSSPPPPPAPPTAEEFLSTFCYARGMLAASSGVPDYPRAARWIIQDYATGKLLYCHPPPSFTMSSSTTTTTTTSSTNTVSTTTAGVVGVVNEEEYARETFVTALQNTKKVRDKLLQQQQQAALEMNDKKNYNDNYEEGEGLNAAEGGYDDGGGGGARGDGDDMVDDDLLADMVGMESTSATMARSSGKGVPSNSHKKHYKKQPGGKKKLKAKTSHDPYGCHASPDELLVQEQQQQQQEQLSCPSSGIDGGVAVKAGKYSHSGYTRPTYTGARGVLPA